MGSFEAIDDRAGRTASPTSPPDVRATSVTPVAVVGMACRLPGGIESPEQLWNALLSGVDLVTEVPSDRWNTDDYPDLTEDADGPSVSRSGAFLDDVAGFDAGFFGIDDREAASIDPQHRLLLENSWEAMENAGLVPEDLRRSHTGVFMGLTHSDYQLMTAGSHAVETPSGYQGNLFAMASGRIARTLGLSGPALTLDAADSSGLLTVHMACRSLHERESDLAFAGAAFVMLDPRGFSAAAKLSHLSPTGRCRTFDAAADGFVFGEASAVVLLKRLPDAVRDGDRILAVVRGTAANQDGDTGDSAPSPSALSSAYRTALAAAGVDADTVGMVEAHGTGSPIGDSTEYRSLTTVYGLENPCALTSVKANVGHAQSASGTLGLIKAVLALQHGTIPPNLHFTGLPANLAREATKLFVPQKITAWPINDGQPRRAAVSSYGISGTNAHAVLEQAPAETRPEGDAPAPTSHLFAVSSTSEDELRRTAQRLANWIDAHDAIDLRDLAYTLGRRRAHRPVRTAVVASSRQQLVAALQEISAGDTPTRAAVQGDGRGPVWVFSGQDSPWAAIGERLLASEPVFAATVARLDEVIARECGFSVAEAMSASEAVSGTALEPTLFTVQIALATTLKAHGVRPAAVIGYSFGEVAAAVVAGALSLDDGVRVICSRSRLLSRIAGSGAMASVKLPAKQVLSELAVRGARDVVVSVVASPQTTVVGGAAESVRDLVAAWQQRDLTAAEIPVDVAPHSPQVDPILDDLTEALAGLNPLTPEIPYYSATQFDPREQPVCDSRYWADNLRNMVRFAAAVRAAVEDGHRVFAELAPDPSLADAVGKIADSLDVRLEFLAAMDRGEELPTGLLGHVADLHSAGAAIDFSLPYPDGRLLDAPLPSWTRRPLWLSTESDDATTRSAHSVAAHPLLGAHVHLHEEPERHVWQKEVETEALSAAAYCEMALAAAQVVFGRPAEVRGIRFEALSPSQAQAVVRTSATFESADSFDFAVQADQGVTRVRVATAKLHTADDEPLPARDLSGLRATRPETEAALTEITLPAKVRSRQEGYGVHPALLDACLQSVGAHPIIKAVAAQGLSVPLGIRSLRLFGEARTARYCLTRVINADAAEAEADFELLDEHGVVLLTAHGLRLGAVLSENDRNQRAFAERLLAIDWLPAQLPEISGTDASFLLISAGAPDAAVTSLAAALKSSGAQSHTMHWSQHADPDSATRELQGHLRTGRFDGAVVMLGSAEAGAAEQPPLLGRQRVEHLTRIANELIESQAGSPRVYVVTRGARSVTATDVADLEQGGLRGLVRAVGHEYPHLHATHIDLDETTDAGLLAQQLLSGTDEDETAWRAGQWYTARLRSAPLTPDERRTAVVEHAGDGMRLDIRSPGNPNSVELVACQRVRPGKGQIEVTVGAAGVSYPDALLALGTLPRDDAHLPQPGLDFAGVVTAVGDGVSSHQVGDRVGGIADGCWRSFITCSAEQAVTLPAQLTEEQAAAITTSYATAWYGLHDLAGIRAGEKVLIHSATGGVGQAAIGVARAAGAEIFATAGSPERRQMLRDMGIEHVYDSRSTGFADDIRRDTDGYGVDVVLNSVSGAALRAGIELLAAGGRFVEIGGQDVHADSRVGLLPFRRNLAFHALDLALMARTHPERIGELLQTVYRLVADGVLPVPTSTHYPISDAAKALETIGAARHTGKFVLDIARAGSSRVFVPPAEVPVFRHDGAYVITGGLGRLGLVLAEKMAAGGCGRIALLSRSQPTHSVQQAIERIRAMGTEIETVSGDIADSDTAPRLVTAATTTGKTLRGVLHLAAAATDYSASAMSDEAIHREWAPKVAGAWHMHVATEGAPLDWFCLFASAATLVGSVEQGARAAADSWLEAFADWRRAQGLPATAIAWGAWTDIDENARALETLLRYDRSFTGYSNVAGTSSITAFVERSPFAEAFRPAGQKSAGAVRLRAELDGLPPDEWPGRMRRLLSDQISAVLRRAVDLDRPLAEYGVDSLGALELRSRVESETGVRLTSFDIAAASVRDLAALLCERIAPAEVA